MPTYRRAFVPGGCRFFTVNLLDRRHRLLTDPEDLAGDLSAPGSFGEC
jgi:putative transposase